MDNKQLLIINTARELLIQNGLHTISINDVVKTCKISKATFYKYFKSKEEMIAEIISHSDEQTLQSVRTINKDNQLSGKDKLEKIIMTIWEQVFPKRTFIVYVEDNFSIELRQYVQTNRKKYHFSLLQEYNNCLIETYGSDAQSIIWDLVLCLDGLAREFIFARHMYQKHIETGMIAHFIIGVLDAIVEKRKHLPALIDGSLVLSVLHDQINNQSHTLEDSFYQTLEVIETTIKNDDTFSKFEKLLQATEIIKEEAKNNQFDSLLIEAMCALLEKEPLLSSNLQLLNKYRYQIIGRDLV